MARELQTVPKEYGNREFVKPCLWRIKASEIRARIEMYKVNVTLAPLQGKTNFSTNMDK